jgi:hypothetical protein
MTDCRNLAAWDQESLLCEIKNVLRSKFGKLPKTGVLAGQCVASAIFEVVGMHGEGRFKDMDLFVCQNDFEKLRSQIEERISAGETHLQVISDRLSEANKKDDVRSMTRGHHVDEASIIQSGYGGEELAIFSMRQYKIVSVIQPIDEYPLNIVKMLYEGNDSEKAEAVISSFDMNVTQAALDLDSDTVHWTQTFQQFLFRPELKVDNFHTPTGTAVRLMEKLEAMPWVECDVTKQLSNLAESRFLTQCYERATTTTDIRVCPAAVGEYRGRKLYSLDGSDQFGEKEFNYKTNFNNQVRMPGTSISHDRRGRWKKYESTLSKFLELPRSPDMLITTDVKIKDFKPSMKPKKEIGLYQSTSKIPMKESIWFRLFGEKLLNSRHFFKFMNGFDAEALSGRMEQMVVHIDWVREISEGQTKEAKARRDLLKNTICPAIEKAIELKDNNKNAMNPEAEFNNKMLVLTVFARRLLTKDDRIVYRGLQTATIEKYVRYMIEERVLVVALMEPFEERKRMMDGYATLRKMEERGLIVGVQHDVNLTPKKILQSSKTQIKEIVRKEKLFLKGLGVVRLAQNTVINGVKIRELCTAEDLRNQGKREHHCVGGYYGPVTSGSVVILAMESEYGRSTAEICIAKRAGKSVTTVGTPNVVQHQASFNSQPHKEHSVALRQWCRELDAAIIAREEGVRQMDDQWGPLADSIIARREGSPNLNLKNGFERILLNDNEMSEAA